MQEHIQKEPTDVSCAITPETLSQANPTSNQPTVGIFAADMIILGSRIKSWQVSNLAYAEDISRSKAKDHDLFLKKSFEMRSGQIFLERLRLGE